MINGHVIYHFKLKKVTRVLHSNSDGALKLELSNVDDSFQYNAAKVFNDLPENLELVKEESDLCI